MSKSITALVPTTVGEAKDLAKVYSTSALLPAELRNKPADVFVTIMAGMELGIAPMAALRTIHIIKGRPVLSADGMVACAQSSGFCEYFRCVESDAEIATYETKRKGSEPVRRSFTIQDAKTADLLGNSTWQKYPAAMLRARAKADLARDVYPDAVAGVYGDEDEARELDEHIPYAAVPVTEPAHTVHDDALDAEIVDIIPDRYEEPRDYPGIIAAAKCEQDLLDLLPELRKLPKDEYREQLNREFNDRIKELRGVKQ